MKIKVQGGIKEAAKLLAGLTKEARDKVLEFISKKDPQMAEDLSKNMYGFEDLQYLTPLMLIELLREVKTSDLGIALRISSPELRDFILKNTPRVLRGEIEEVLKGPPQLASKVEEAQEKIMNIVRQKIDKGHLVINKDSSDTLV